MESRINNDRDYSDNSLNNNNDEERKGVKDDYRQGAKAKPKTLMNKKLPHVFSNQIKYKNNKNEQYIKQIKDVARGEEARKSKQTTLDPMPISIEQK